MKALCRNVSLLLSYLMVGHAAGAFACEVPVFKYALDRWPADIYRVTVVHRNALDAPQQAMVNALRQSSSSGMVNVSVETVDVATDSSGALTKLWTGQQNPVLPCIVVRYPEFRTPAKRRFEFPMDGSGPDAHGPPGAPVPPGMPLPPEAPVPPGMPVPPPGTAVPPWAREPPHDAMNRLAPEPPMAGDPEMPMQPGFPGMMDPRRRSMAANFVVWSSPLVPEAVLALLDSPVRRELARRILSGDSIVWLILESGDKAADEQCVAFIQSELPRLEGAMKEKVAAQRAATGGQFPVDAPPAPPPGGPWLNGRPPGMLPAPPPGVAAPQPPGMSAPPPPDGANPVKIAFSILRVSPKDAKEAVLVAQLRVISKALANAKGPVVFPVFGRGRVLEGIVGAGITAVRMDAVATFLCGDCSCEVKEQNPGTDLLVAANWENTVGRPTGPITELPSLAALAVTRHEPAAVPVSTNLQSRVPPKAVEPVTEPGDNVLKRNLTMAACGFLILVVIVSVMIMRKPSSKKGGK